MDRTTGLECGWAAGWDASCAAALDLGTDGRYWWYVENVSATPGEPDLTHDADRGTALAVNERSESGQAAEGRRANWSGASLALAGPRLLLWLWTLIGGCAFSSGAGL
mmetsp:Transcript_17260/g.30798  ORF Transcript_17260/g.30798 Transcript_17260/m.30798 type:complete len:108 (-) Transcript_17260:304-627(-)